MEPARSEKSVHSSYSKQGQNSITLPRLPSSGSQQVHTAEFTNPFYCPPDDEAFKMKEVQKEQKRLQRIENQQKKIWEKGVKGNEEGRLKMVQEMVKQAKGEMKEQDQKVNIVEAANSAIKNRVRQKEPMHKFIEKKREMFLFQMLIDQKREQINQFEEMAKEHERGLQKSELMLEEDLEKFNKFLEKNKNKSRTAIKKAEDETKNKQAKINLIKTLNEKKADYTTKNSQKIENLEDLWRYKQFLDKLTPEDQKKQRQSKVSKQQSPQLQSTNKKKKRQFEQYIQQLDKELLQMLEDSDEEFEMYFKEPETLQKYFESLEEKNLFLINNTKDEEVKLEEMRKKNAEMKQVLTLKKDNALKQKNELQKQIESLNEEIKMIKQVRNDNEVLDILQMLQKEIQSEYSKYFNKKNKDKTQKEEKFVDTDGIDILRQLEKELDDQIKTIKPLKSNKQFQEKMAKVIFERKGQVSNCVFKIFQNKVEKDLLREQELKEQQELLKNRPVATKRLIYQQKSCLNIKCRVGRPIMAKTILPEKDQEQVVDDVIDEEEQDRLLYFT